jgi:hypothetical protein
VIGISSGIKWLVYMANVEEVKPAQKKIADEDPNVICKMYVKGKPNNLIEIVKNILTPLNAKNGSGYYSENNTDSYALTILVEKVKKE